MGKLSIFICVCLMLHVANLSALVVAQMSDECFRSARALATCSARLKKPSLDIDNVLNGDSFEGSEIGFQQKLASAGKPAFPARGALRWIPTWGPDISRPQNAGFKKIIQEAMAIWSSLIEDQITLRVNIESRRFLGLIHGFADSSDVQMEMGNYASNILQPKLTHNGYTTVKFPPAETLRNLMRPPSGWSNPETKLHITYAEMKTCRADLAATLNRENSVDGNFTIDNRDDAPTTWETNLAKMISPGEKDSLLWVAIHELGHILGFRSVVDEVDAAIIDRDKFKPRPLDMFRFRGDRKIDFMSTPRILEPSATLTHVWSDPVPIDGRLPSPRFSRGASQGDFYQAAHWDVPDQTIRFPGLMTAFNGDFELPSAFTLPDIRAFSRLGYKINLFAKPRLYGIWRKPLKSGTYFGVYGMLLLTPNIEFEFRASNGQTCVIRSRSATYMTSAEATTDIGSFLVRRKNLFTSFRLHAKDKLPLLNKALKWTVRARNWSDVLNKSGKWSNALPLPSDWMKIPIAENYANEPKFDPSKAPAPQFVACSPAMSTKPPGSTPDAGMLR